MQLGEMLVNDGVIRREQLEAALAAQVVHGGRLGTNLIERRALDLDALANALARQRGVPAALESHFEVVEPALVRALPAVAAARHLAVPIGYANKARTQVIVAFADPHKLSSVDEVAFAMSARVQPWVAPELRILYNLERLYGLRRPNRYLRVDAARASAPSPAVADEASASGTERRRYVEANPPLVEPAPPPPAPAPEPVTTAPSPSPPPPKPSVPDVPTRPAFVPPDPTSDSLIHPTFESPAPMTTVAEARVRISGAESRDEIAAALVDYVRTAFGHGLVMIVREGMALGWRGTVAAGTEESIAVPLDAPTLLAAAFRSDGSFVRGEPPPEGAALHARLASLLGTQTPPRDVVVATVAIRRRVVNLVYAHARDAGPLRDDAVASLTSLCDEAATAYTRLLQRAKTERTDAPAPAPTPAKRRGWKKPGA